MGDQREAAVALVAVGKGFLCEARWDQAADAFRKAAEVGQEDSRALAWATYASGRAALAQGQRPEARKALWESLRLDWPDALHLVDQLGGLEEACDDPEAFSALCQRYRAEHPEARDSPFIQWYLEPAEPDAGFRILEFGLPTSEDQIRDPQSPIRNREWVWHDPFGDGSFTIRDGWEIRAANGRDLWHPNRGAPRLLRSVSGDFALQAVCRPVRGVGPAMGGLLLWRSNAQYLRLDWGARGPHQITMGGCLPGIDLPDQVRWWKRDVIIGRGRLSAPRVVLRLERRGTNVRALCSAEGERWFLVGQTAFPADGALEVGVYAIGMIDRMIYPGAYPEGTAIRFESLELWS
jgi:hypothetical protein